MDEKKFDPNDLVQDNSPIDGQLGLEDLYYEISTRPIDNQETPPQPLEGQMSLQDLMGQQLNTNLQSTNQTDSSNDNSQLVNNDNKDNLENLNNNQAQDLQLNENRELSTFNQEDLLTSEWDENNKQVDYDKEKVEANTFDDNFYKQFDHDESGQESVLFSQINNVNKPKTWQKEWLEGSTDKQEESFEQFIDSKMPKQNPELVEKHYETPQELEILKQAKLNENNVNKNIEDYDKQTIINNVDVNTIQKNLQNKDIELKEFNPKLIKGNTILEDINNDLQFNSKLNQEQTEIDSQTEESIKDTNLTSSVEENLVVEQEESENQLEYDYDKNNQQKVDESVLATDKQNTDEESFVENSDDSFVQQSKPNEQEPSFDEENLQRNIEAVEESEDEEYDEESLSKSELKSSNNNSNGNGGSSGDGTDGLIVKNLDEVLHDSMIPYSEHVILDRALPRVEDGLKPVQRRILYSMLELGVTPDKPYRKSARIVGDCMGKYHPHGDSSVYDAMVRMAQPYNINGVLVDGHGNFGSIDGDRAAAMRYTEARLAPLALELLRDLEKDTVKWSLNFDDTLKEPDTLPGRFPNLLVNGASGIAVGLATNIPPHNLAECIDGVVAYIDNPKISLKEMMKYIKGPDFPTGGYILPTSEIEQAYTTGKGKIVMRAKMHIEGNGTDKRSIVITELPYQVNKSTVLQRIANLRDEGKNVLSGISDIRDESDRNGIRAVIKLKKDANLKAITEFLLKYTDLQCTFGINMVAIADGKPKQMSLLEVIAYYVNYQRDVILRRSKFELEQAKEREHILSGLLIAIKNIDAVIKIIKTSANTTQAKQRLREKFNLSERQAQAILDMRLSRLTNLEVNKLELEIKGLRQLIAKLTEIVGSKKLQLEIVKNEMLGIKRQYKSERKSTILKANASLELPADTDKKQVMDVYIAYNALGNIKIINRRYFSSVQKEFKENSTLNEVHNLLVKSDTEKTAMIFTNIGNCYKVAVSQIPESRFKDKGQPVTSVIKDFNIDEKIVAIFSVDEEMPKGNLIFLTKQGMIKKTAFKDYNVSKSTFQAIKLKDDDQVLSIDIEQKDSTLLFVTCRGMVLNADKSDVPLQGRISGGVKGINLTDNDYCVCATQVSDEGEAVILTDRGYIKRVLISQIETMARYRKGVKIYNLNDKEYGEKIIFADYVKNPYIVVAKTNKDEYLSRNTDLIPIEARLGKGKLIEKSRTAPHIEQAYKYLID